MNKKELKKELYTLKNNFKNTLLDVSELLDIQLHEIKRDDYVRITVDFDLSNRLNKEELNLLGGFTEAKKLVMDELSNVTKPKILVIDIETFPIEGFVWNLWNNNLSLNQIKQDWTILSFAAKWFGENEVFYDDVRNEENLRNDKRLLEKLWKLLDEADYCLTQNGKSFDLPKIKARMVLNKMKPFSSVKHIDTKIIASKEFAFTSNKLEYMSHNLCTENKKLVEKKYHGQTLWNECLKRNLDAFNEMEEYNKMDILSLEELAKILIPWTNIPNFDLFHEESHNVCFCGSTSFERKGYYYTSVSKFRKYQCVSCGAETRDRKNLIKKDKSKKLVISTSRN